jgi:hypothetical protein
MISHSVLNNKPQIYSNWLQEKILNLSTPTFKIPYEYAYEIMETTERHIARPDLVSIDIYGDASYADLLCKLNGISNPFELNEGTLLIVPSPDRIMDFANTPKISDNDVNANAASNNKPVAKTKNQKRKANEAVIGDSRFKIDKNNGIVIY